MTNPLNGSPDSNGFNTPPLYRVGGISGADAKSIIDPLHPPAMKTLIYSPDVRVYIFHGAEKIDISKDLIKGTVVRRENSVSSIFLTIANKKSRYNGKFDRMDKIVVYMKRTEWIPVFTGFLDSVPYAQMYPGAVELRASCTLKKLLHTWWNPALPASLSFFDQYAYAQQAIAGDGQLPSDSGLGSMLRDILTKVGGWAQTDIKIQNFPLQFLLFLETAYGQIESKSLDGVRQFRRLLLGDDISAGVGTAAGSYSGAAATRGAYGLSAPFYVKEIIAAVDARKMGPITQDLTNSQQLIEAGETGADTGNPGTYGDNVTNQKAWQQITQSGASYQQSAKNSDAAILAVACAMAESNLLMRANPVVPESFNFPFEAISTDHDSIGLFQQRSQGWGSVADRMNARTSAGMFLDQLQKLDWRNMDPGAAIHTVQRNGTGDVYTIHIAAATEMVQGIRTAQGVYGPATGIPGPTSMVTSVIGGVPGLPGITTPGGSTDLLVDAPTTAEGIANALKGNSKPVPDSEGAINAAFNMIGTPYFYGGKTRAAFDCSGMITLAFRSIGLEVGDGTSGQMARANVPRGSWPQRGDIVVNPDNTHVVLALGGDLCIDTGGPNGVPMPPPHPFYFDPRQGYIQRACPNGGVDPTAPFNLAAGPGIAPGTGYTGGLGSGSSGSQEQIARNLFSFQFTPGIFSTKVADIFAGEKAFIDDQPLIQMIQAVCKAGLRNFASSPTGEFVAYYPDWFGLDGKQAILKLEDIECKDVRINFNDDALTTHVYVAGDITQWNRGVGPEGWLDTCGVVTVEDQWLYRRLTAIGPDGGTEALDPQSLMRKFGVRPLAQEYPLAGSHKLEFLIATHLFMMKWAEQFETTVQFTFMPELFPGMRVELQGHNLQVYVSEVTHNFDFQNGFTTSAKIMAPSTSKVKEIMQGNSIWQYPGSGSAGVNMMFGGGQ